MKLMNELFIFHFLCIVYYDVSNNYSYFSLVKEKITEVALRRCSLKQVLLKISQNSQENTYVGSRF